MINPNDWHPYPRYGLAAAVVEQNAFAKDLTNMAELVRLAKHSLELGLSKCILYTQDIPRLGETLSYQNLSRDQYFAVQAGSNFKLKTIWGKEIKKENGFLVAPHVLTGSNAGGIVSKIIELIADLSKPINRHSETCLFQSFAPMVREVLNEGRSSPSDPKTSLLEAAFTAVATLTTLKPCIYTRIPLTEDKNANYGLIPDLDIWKEGAIKQRPLIEFVRVFKALSETYEGDKYTAKVGKKGDYSRPACFYGNYPGATTFSSGPLGVVSLLAAVGRWAREVGSFSSLSASNWAMITLDSLQNRPLYIVSNAGTIQETFGHHLIELVQQSDLTTIVSALHKAELFYDKPQENSEEKNSKKKNGKSNNDPTPKEKLYRMMAERFLRLYTPDSFQNFLAYRATYPVELRTLINHYMTQHRNIDLDIVQSARAYGASLNRAAYLIGKENNAKDPSRTIDEYKNRVLTELESTLGSNTSSSNPLSRLGSIIGRATFRDIDSDAARFIEAVFTGAITPKEASDLIITFMRLNTYQAKTPPVPNPPTIEAYPDDITNESKS